MKAAMRAGRKAYGYVGSRPRIRPGKRRLAGCHEGLKTQGQPSFA